MKKLLLSLTALSLFLVANIASAEPSYHHHPSHDHDHGRNEIDLKVTNNPFEASQELFEASRKLHFGIERQVGYGPLAAKLHQTQELSREFMDRLNLRHQDFCPVYFRLHHHVREVVQDIRHIHKVQRREGLLAKFLTFNVAFEQVRLTMVGHCDEHHRNW